MIEIKDQKSYFIVLVNTKYISFQDALTKDSEAINEHLTRSKELHSKGSLVMSGAFLDSPKGHLSTMAICTSRQSAEDYIKGDPFMIKGMIDNYSIREWANMFSNSK